MGRLRYNGLIKEKAKERFDSLKLMQEWIKDKFNKELSIKTISY